MLIYPASAPNSVSWCTFSADYKGVCIYFLPVIAIPCYNQVPAPVSFDRLNKLYGLNLPVQGIFISDLRSTLLSQAFFHIFFHIF